MSDPRALAAFLADARVDAAVFALRPDYRALLVAVDGLVPGPSDTASDDLLRSAEVAAADVLSKQPVEEIPRVAAWRDAYRAFGAKPQRTRNSLEALMRRASSGLPRVNRLTDVYNAVSILHQLPCGGEDLTRYSGPPRLLRAAGTEPFDTVAGGATVIEHPEPGEVIWYDDAGVTCRRWNWRQAHRTQLRDDTTTALFILDALDPLTDKELDAAGDDLIAHLTQLGADVGVARRLLSATTSLDQGTVAMDRFQVPRYASTARTRRLSSSDGCRPSRWKIDAVCLATARSEITSCWPMAALERPSAIRPSTSRSRGLSAPTASLSVLRASRRAITSGSMAVPPVATRRTASTNWPLSNTRSFKR